MAWVDCLTLACKRPATSRKQDHGGSGRGVARQFDDGEAGHGLALGVVGGAFGEVGLLVILVAFGLADGQGHGQVEAAKEVFEIGGVLAGGVDADVEVGLGMLLVEMFETILQGLIAGLVFDDGERFGGGLAIGPEEGDAMAVACGVDADADAVERSSGDDHEGPPRREVPAGHRVRQASRGAREPPPGIFGKVILVISGQSRMMYQSLVPKPEGTIFSKRSKPQGTDRSPHDAATIIKWLEMIIQGDIVLYSGSVLSPKRPRPPVDPFSNHPLQWGDSRL